MGKGAVTEINAKLKELEHEKTSYEMSTEK